MTNLDSPLTVAKQALSAGDYAKAVEEANAAIKADANNGEAYSNGHGVQVARPIK
ncbi:MAG: hypothetical protein E7B67_09950 [Veillonella sp.]|nr:hypothetical protein [Veillonella sp.]